MASIYDFGGIPSPPSNPDPKPVKRSKKRESLSTTEIRVAKQRLSDMVERAFETLETAMECADYGTAIKAAQIILDRAGFGPKSTVDVNTTHLDLSSLSKEELAERASKIAGLLRASRTPPDINIGPPSTALVTSAPDTESVN